MKTDSMHVVLLSRSFPTEYDRVSAVFVSEQSKALCRAGMRVAQIAVVFVSWKKIRRFRLSGFGYRTLKIGDVQVRLFVTPVVPFMKKINQLRRDRLLKKLMNQYISEHGTPDICHNHGFYTGNETIRLKQLYNIPFVTTEHYSVFAKGMLSNWENRMAQKVFSESNKRIAVSTDFKELLQERFKLDFIYVPNIVDLKKFHSINFHSRKTDQFTILNVGKLDVNKNQRILVDALSMLPEDFSLILVGDGPEKGNLLRRAKEIGVESRVDFIGFVDYENIVPYFQAADVLAITSTYETFGIVMIEAFGAGIPVVSTAVGVAPSVLNDHRLGMISEANAESFADCLLKIRNTNFDKKFIRNFAMSHFSEEIIVEKLKSIYINAIERNNNKQ